MSEHRVAGAGPLGPEGFMDAVVAAIRAPSGVTWDATAAAAVYVFTPDLTPAEATTFADLVAVFRTHDVELTPADYAAIKPHLATGRAFLALSQSDFIAITNQNQRDRMLFDNISAQWRVLFRLLRD